MQGSQIYMPHADTANGKLKAAFPFLIMLSKIKGNDWLKAVDTNCTNQLLFCV